MKSPATNKSGAKAIVRTEDPGIASGIEASFGEIKIHDGVFTSLARQAALSVEGVSRLAGNHLVDNIAEIVGSKRMQARALSVNVDDENRIQIEIKINIKFGYNIPEVADQVQKEVIKNIEAVTSMTVSAVNVLIQDVEDPVDEDDDSSAEDN